MITMAHLVGLLTLLAFISSCSYMKGSESLLNKLSRSIASTEDLHSQMASIRSIVNEINVNGKKVLTLYAYPKGKVTTFDGNDRIKTLLAKMKVAQKELLYQTSTNNINSAEGQKVLLMVVDYLQAVITINKIYAQVAHLSALSNFLHSTSDYSWKNLDQYNLKIDKDYALILLSKINFHAQHLPDQKGVEIKLGGEIRQLLEHLAISDPTTASEYGLYLKFNALRETMINAWGINRLYKDPYKGSKLPVTNSTLDTLTFRPGADKTFSTAEYYQELMQSDDYYNVFSLEVQKIVEATKSSKTVSMSLGSAAEYEELYHALIWGSENLPAFTHLRDYYLGKGKYQDYTPYTKSDVSFKFPGEEVRETEEYHYNGDAPDAKIGKDQTPYSGRYPHLYYSVLLGDELTPENISTKMAQDAYQFRSEAIVQHLHYRIVDEEFSEKMKTDLADKIRLLVDSKFKTRYVNYFKGIIKPLLAKKLEHNNLVQRKVNDKYASIKNALTATEGIKSAFIDYSYSTLNKTPVNAFLYPKSPEILIAMTQEFLQNKGSYDSPDFLYALNDKDTGEVVKQFYTDLSNTFYNKTKGNETFEELAQILWDALNKTAYTYYKKYPYVPIDVITYRQEKDKQYIKAQDNTYVDIKIKYPTVQSTTGKIGKAFSDSVIGSKKETKTKTETKTQKEPKTFDEKLETLMLTFQPFVQGQDLKDMKLKGSALKNKITEMEMLKAKHNESNILPSTSMTLSKIFELMGVDTLRFRKAHKAKSSTYYSITGKQNLGYGAGKQLFLAEQNLGLLKMMAPLLQNKILHKKLKHSHVTGGTVTGSGASSMGSSGKVTYTYEYIYKPAIVVMGLKAYDDNKDTIDKTAVSKYIGEAITSSRKALKGEAHAGTPSTPFDEGLYDTFAQANPRDSENNKRFQFMYDHLEELRAILMNGNGNLSKQEKLGKLDRELFAKIHPYKYFYESYIAPVINVVVAVIMVISLVVGFVFPPAGIPGWLAASLLVFEVSAFTYIMADNIGYRIVYQRMFEIPATLKMQGHLAAIDSIGESPLSLMYKKGAEDETKAYKINSALDSWDRISAAEKANIEERKSMLYERMMWLPLDLMWGAGIVKQFKSFTGQTGLKAMKKMGLPVLTFRQKVQMVFKTNNWEQVFKEKGLLRGVGSVGKDIVQGVPHMSKLLPKYQPYATELLEKHGLRIGLHNKFRELYESRKYAKEFSAVVSDVKYSLEGENIVLHQLFKEIKNFDSKQFTQFIEYQSSNKITILMEKIKASLEKGVTPLELEAMAALSHIPKTVWGKVFNGVFSKNRVNKLKSVLKPGVQPAEALKKYREAKALNDVDAINKVFEEVLVAGHGYKDELLMQVFDQAGLKTSLSNTIKTVQENFASWKALKAPEVELTNNMLKLKEELKNAKHIRSKALADKAKSVEELLEKNPEFYKDLNFSTVNDYWWSILDHSDLMLIHELSAAAKSGSSVKEFSLVFVDYRIVMETIRPLEWKLANESRELRPVNQEPTFKTDYEDTIINEENFFPADGFGEKKSSSVKLLEEKISEQLN